MQESVGIGQRAGGSGHTQATSIQNLDS